MSQQQNTMIEVAQQLGNKELPTNEQINSLFDSTQQFIDNKKSNPNVDKNAMKVMSDFQGVLDATKQLNENKNFDECLQSTLTQTSVAASQMADKARQQENSMMIGSSILPAAERQGKELMEQGQQLTTAVWEVLRSMVTSGELRSHLSTLLGVAQDILSSAQDRLDSSTTTSTTVTSGGSNKTSSETSTDNTVRIGLSEERKHELAFNLLSLFRKFHQTPELKSSFERIVNIFQMLLHRQQSSALPDMMNSSLQSNPHMDAAFTNSKELVERFSQRPLDPFLLKSNAFFDFIRRDERVRKWFDDAEKLLRDCFDKPECLDQYEFTRRTEQLVDEAQEVTEAREFKANYKGMVSELRAIVETIQEDEDLRRLQERTNTFLENFTSTDSQGVKHFNIDLLQSLRQFVVPLLVSQLDTIPLPPIEGSNEDYDYRFENMVLHGREIMPDMIELHTSSDARIDLKNLSAEKARTQFELSVSNIRLSLADVHFQFVRKTFPRVSDEGVATVSVQGPSGVSLTLGFDLFLENNAPRLKLSKVNFDIDKLNIDIQQTQHEVLTRMFATIYQTRTKMLIEQNAEQKIREIFEKMESGMNDLFVEYSPSKLKDAVQDKASEMMNLKPSQHQQQEQETMQAIQS